MRADYPSKSVVVFAQHALDGFGLRVGREGGEAPQVAEHHGHLDAPAIEHAVAAGAVNQLCHLRREEALEPAYALRALP